MPNWCENRLYITGPATELVKFFNDNKSKRDDEILHLDFGKSVPPPVPQEKWKDLPHDEAKIKEENLFDWYSWSVENWGTKWNIDPSDISVERNTDLKRPYLLYRFLTAWSPPEQWMIAVIKKYPKLFFSLEFNEYGMCFTGGITGENGSVLSNYSRDMTNEEANLEDY